MKNRVSVNFVFLYSHLTKNGYSPFFPLELRFLPKSIQRLLRTVDYLISEIHAVKIICFSTYEFLEVGSNKMRYTSGSDYPSIFINEYEYFAYTVCVIMLLRVYSLFSLPPSLSLSLSLSRSLLPSISPHFPFRPLFHRILHLSYLI